MNPHKNVKPIVAISEQNINTGNCFEMTDPCCCSLGESYLDFLNLFQKTSGARRSALHERLVWLPRLRH